MIATNCLSSSSFLVSPIAARKRSVMSTGLSDQRSRLRGRRSQQWDAVGSACLEVLEDRRLLSFAPAVSYAPGADPREIIAADFNNDGQLDLVVANPTANSVNVLLGNGDGTFQSPLPSAAGTNPRSIAVGDFNADGKLDLAAVSGGSSGVNVMRGNGNGTFAAPDHVAVGAEVTHSVATGDFNNDGKMDLVVSSNYLPGYGYPQGQLDVLLAIGDGSFATPRTFWMMDRALGSVVVADFNGDGNRDVVTELSDYSTVIVALGDGHGNLAGQGWAGWARSEAPSAAADLTGDGRSDVVVAGGLLRGDGAGSFVSGFPEQPETAGSGPGTVALGDFDHDGHLDIAKTDGIVRYAGNGTFSSEELYVPAPDPGATAVAAGDFNGDGWLDVATANSTGDTVSVLLNDRTWGVTPPAISVGDAATITEGNMGTLNATFTVTLSKPSTAAVTVSYATSDVTATAGSDYVAKTGTLTIPAGQTSGTFTVAVMGDRIVESTETFAVELTSATNATISNAWGSAVILDDEPRINIGNVSKSEGDRKTTTFSFTVSLSTAYDQAVTVNYATANGTAMAGSDYQAKSGSVTFAPGETIKTITIVVNGDRSKELNETFFVDLFGPSSNAVIGVARGTGTIFNDDKR